MYTCWCLQSADKNTRFGFTEINDNLMNQIVCTIPFS